MNAAWNVLYIGWFLSEIAILLLTRTRRGGGNVRDRGSLLLLWIVITSSILTSSWIGYATPTNMLGGAHWLTVASLAVIAAGLAIRWFAVLSLGRSFSANVAIHETQRVYKSGLFRLVRHPSYLGLMLVFLALGIRTRNWYSLGIVLIFPFAALLYRIHVEEAALKDAFGQEYIEYCRVTKRLLPGIY